MRTITNEQAVHSIHGGNPLIVVGLGMVGNLGYTIVKNALCSCVDSSGASSAANISDIVGA